MYDFIVIGGGIVELSTARALYHRFPTNASQFWEKNLSGRFIKPGTTAA
jgi:L-2-hydroxyglutarate oxidase LhgO